MTVQNETATVQNGVNVEALLGAREAMEETPELGLFTWRARAKWAGGIHTQIEVDGFYGLNEEQTRGRVHKIDSDHPEHFAAADKGATPVEIVLAALAGCLGAGVASVAQHRGIQLRSVEARVEGDMDMAGIMGIDPAVRNGFSAIRIDFQIDADATGDEIAALVAQSQKRSAVFDIITNPTNVHATVTKVGAA
ncbi:MAG: OsmC family protein [Pseudomonadota bacterium]